MNERIKELWEEAAKTTQGDSWEEQTKFMERFAELIVKECCDIVHSKTDESIRVVMAIEEHFGVEQ
jgi:leucyl aminopeptidase (aminopeptidase T)